MPGGSPAQAGTVLRSPGDTEAPCTLEGMAGGGALQATLPEGPDLSRPFFAGGCTGVGSHVLIPP